MRRWHPPYRSRRSTGGHLETHVSWSTYLVNILILTPDEQVEHMADRKRIGELLRRIRPGLGGKGLRGLPGGALLYPSSLPSRGSAATIHPRNTRGTFGGYQGR